MEVGERGFGVLTGIKGAATREKRLYVEIVPYWILGSCNHNMAWQAIGIEPRMEAMLPCNVILGAVYCEVEVSAFDHVTSIQAIENPALHAGAEQVRDLMARADAAI